MTGRRLIVIGILALAAAARLWGLTEFPPGLYPDQAANGFDALEILDGNPQVFSLANNGRESLFFYVQALTISLFGVGVWPLFLASALVGIVTVGVTYAAGARLFGPLPGAAAALFLATNPWHVTLSRTGFRAVMVPLFIALSLWCIARVLLDRPNSQRGLDALLAGVFTGLGLYTYPSYRAFIVFLALGAAIGLLRCALQPAFRARVRALLPSLVVAGGTAIIVALPLVTVLTLHPEFAAARVNHVSIFNPALNHGDPLRTFLTMSGRTVRAFMWNGDGNPRHNVPLPGISYTPGGIHHFEGGGAPFLSFIPAVLAIMGLLVAARRAPWVVVLFFLMLAPAALTAEGIPHGLRTVGAIPAHAWLAGLGAALVWRGIRLHPWTPVRAGARALALALVLFTAISDLTLYFGVARNAPLAHYEYRADLTAVSNYLNSQQTTANSAKDAPPYLVLDRFSEMTVRFLTTPSGRRYRVLDPATSHLTFLAPGEEMVFTQSTLPDVARYQAVHPEIVVREVKENRFGEVVMVVLEAPGAPAVIYEEHTMKRHLPPGHSEGAPATEESTHRTAGHQKRQILRFAQNDRPRSRGAIS